MNDGKKAAPPEVVEKVTQENFNLVWAYVDWALGVERFRLPSVALTEFRRIPQALKDGGASLALLNDWMAHHLEAASRRRVFSDIRRAQFEAAKGAVQITIAEETRTILKKRKTALFGEGRGSMEVTLRHLLEAEQRSLPLQAFRLLEAFQQRNDLASLDEAVKMLVDQAELAAGTPSRKREPLRQEIVQLLEELKEG